MGQRNSKRKSNSCSRPWISRALNRPIKSYKESGSDTEHSNRTHTEECRTWKQVLRFSFIKEKRRTCFQVLHSSVCVLLLCSVSDPDSLQDFIGLFKALLIHGLEHEFDFLFEFLYPICFPFFLKSSFPNCLQFTAMNAFCQTFTVIILYFLLFTF